MSRNGVDHSKRFPELVAGVGTLRSSSLVLDAEVAILDQQLRSRFDWALPSRCCWSGGLSLLLPRLGDGVTKAGCDLQHDLAPRSCGARQK